MDRYCDLVWSHCVYAHHKDYLVIVWDLLSDTVPVCNFNYVKDKRKQDTEN